MIRVEPLKSLFIPLDDIKGVCCALETVLDMHTVCECGHYSSQHLPILNDKDETRIICNMSVCDCRNYKETNKE